MNIISKEKFVEIIERLKDTSDTVEKANNLFRECKNGMIRDFANACGIMICHDEIVIKLLDTMFASGDLIDWWCFELEYGKLYKDGCIKEKDGTIIDVSTAEKLYEYVTYENKLIKEDEV